MKTLYWILGFLKGKENLNKEQITEIEQEISRNLPIAEVIIPFIQHQEYGCKYPSNCGLPQTWFSITPPICNKCGYQAPNLDITFTSSSTSNI